MANITNDLQLEEYRKIAEDWAIEHSPRNNNISVIETMRPLQMAYIITMNQCFREASRYVIGTDPYRIEEEQDDQIIM